LISRGNITARATRQAPHASSGLGEAADRVLAGVEAQVQVRVHQARHQRKPGQVYDVRTGGDRTGRAVDGGDHTVRDNHRRPRHECRADAIEHGRGAQGP
jgi:hypothetical protein